jgi:hypothetical protein
MEGNFSYSGSSRFALQKEIPVHIRNIGTGMGTSATLKSMEKTFVAFARNYDIMVAQP